MKITSGSRGSATILMMMIASVIITVGLGFNWLVREHIQASEGLKNKVDAMLKARSAYDTVIYLLLNGRFSSKEIIITGGTDITALKTLPLNGRTTSLPEEVQVRLQDTNGMLSLVSLRTGTMENLIKKTANSHLDNASGPVNSLLDWIDADDFTRPNGAETFYYSGQGSPYVPRNYALQYKEEVGFIKGIGSDLYEKIQPYLTMLPATGFNPNTASDTVLMACLDLNDESLKAMKEFMSQKPITSDRELFALTGRRLGGEDDFFPSRFMEVTFLSGAPKTIYRINVGLHLKQNIHSPYSVIYWREG